MPLPDIEHQPITVPSLEHDTVIITHKSVALSDPQ